MWVKKDPTLSEMLNDRVLSSDATLARGSDKNLLGVWPESDAPGLPQLKFRDVNAVGLGPSHVLVDSPSGLVPTSPSNVVPLAGGGFAVAFVDNEASLFNSRVYLVGFQADGQILFPPKLVSAAPSSWRHCRIASSGNRVAVVYEDLLAAGAGVHVRVYDTMNRDFGTDFLISAGGASGGVAGLSQGFVVGWLDPTPPNDPVLQYPRAGWSRSRTAFDQSSDCRRFRDYRSRNRQWRCKGRGTLLHRTEP